MQDTAGLLPIKGRSEFGGGVPTCGQSTFACWFVISYPAGSRMLANQVWYGPFNRGFGSKCARLFGFLPPGAVASQRTKRL